MTQHESGRARYWLLLTVLVVILDQLTKWWAESELLYHQPIAVMPMLNLTLAYNTGAAFSFLSNAGGWQRWFFVILTVIVCAVLLKWLWQLKNNEKLQAVALALVLGGALGNLIDRLQLGHVVDFIDVYYGQQHWPIFNLADSAITLGVIFLLLDAFFDFKRQRDTTSPESSMADKDD